MNLDWNSFFTADLMQRFGWVMLHSIWQIAFIAALFALANRMLVRCSPSSRYIVGCLALGMMLAIPAGTFLTLLSLPQFKSQQPEQMAGVESDPLPSQRTEDHEEQSSRLGGATSSNHVKDRIESPRTVEDALESLDARGDDLHPTFAWRIEAAFPSVVVCWFLGAAVMLCRPLLGFITTQRLRSTGVSDVPEFVDSLTQRLKIQMGLKRSVKAVESALVSVPSVIGLFYPIILLPASVITSLPPDQLAVVIAHELAHIRRNDFLVNLLQTVVEALLFYHPLVWWVSHCVRQEREYCCDDAAIMAGGNRLNYAQALFAVDQLRGSYSQLSLSVAGGSVVNRIRRLRGEPNHSRHGLEFCCSLAAMAIGLTLTYAAVPVDVEAASREAKSLEEAESKTLVEEAKPSLESFDRMEIDLPFKRGNLSSRFEIASDGSYSLSLLGLPCQGDKKSIIYRRRGTLSSESLTLVEQCLNSRSDTKRFESFERIDGDNRKCPDLSVRLRSGDGFSMKPGLGEFGLSGERLSAFLHKMIEEELGKLPFISWEPYSKQRVQEAVAKELPVLQYLVSPKFADQKHTSVGQFPETIRLLEKHGVVCLSNCWESSSGELQRKDLPQSPKFPDSRFGLSLFLPKTGQTISISSDRVGSVYFALKRTLEAQSANRLIDIGGNDFSIFTPIIPKRIGDLKFSVITEADWLLPEQRGDTRILPIHFRMQSAVGRETYFPRAGTHFPVLEDSAGNLYRYTGNTHRDRPSDRWIRGQGKSTFRYFAFLEKDKNTGIVYFCFRDGLRRVIRLGPIAPGDYRLKFELRPCPLTEEQRSGSRPANLWAGQGSTWSVPITVHDWTKTTHPRIPRRHALSTTYSPTEVTTIDTKDL